MTGQDAYALLTTLELFTTVESLGIVGSDGYITPALYADGALVIDLSEEGYEDILLILELPKSEAEYAEKLKITVYPLPSRNTEGDYFLRMEEETVEWLEENESRPWYETLTFRFAKDVQAKYKVGSIADQIYTGSALKPSPAVQLVSGSYTLTLKKGRDYTLSYQNNINVGTATVVITGKKLPIDTMKKAFKIVKAVPGYDRLSGADRYATSRAIADAYKKALGVTKFNAICIADGQNYPDALAGAYFAARKKAPILVVHQQAPTGDKSMATINYVKANLPAGKTVYILGGPGSVPDVVVTNLKKAGYKVQRLWGANRYGSNLEILKAAQVPAGTDFIVCTGAQFADALSASATGKPVLLVAGNKLTEDQKAYLKGIKAKRFIIVGTAKEVATAIEAELKTYAPVTRLSGKTVYERSIQIAKKFFPATVNHLNLADGRNFPDALCGGPLAQKLGGPLLLTDGSAAVNQKIRTYASGAKAMKATVFGGPASVTDATVKYILSMN